MKITTQVIEGCTISIVHNPVLEEDNTDVKKEIDMKTKEQIKKELEDMLKQITKDKEKEKPKPVDKNIYYQDM